MPPGEGLPWEEGLPWGSCQRATWHDGAIEENMRVLGSECATLEAMRALLLLLLQLLELTLVLLVPLLQIALRVPLQRLQNTTRLP